MNIRNAIRNFFNYFRNSSDLVAKSVNEGLVGVSVLGVDAKNIQTLVSHATLALLELNKDSDKRISYYDRKTHQQLERKRRLKEHVVKCIKNQDIAVYFQSLVATRSGQIDKFEALCRFPNLAETPASTQELIDIVEEIDMVLELDDIVCREAMLTLSELQSLFGSQVGLSLNRSLNVKANIDEVLGRTVQLVDLLKVNPDKLTIEFTESAYFQSDV
ncbi:EAL domain-containing protein [Vibrio tubiashii]|uniref:EAL domain-containing protein n=1 Tax=Vibrio tubiashii TaxID=29498 RepID=UPI001EFE65B2|nr:EAL domain-containing protein [Vibrio tubiashii]MCG9578929.1 EAL domain-containing protein [Vibrio tubiashii]